ncbi:DUF1254 domain-containing protein [Raoultella planticola]|uniref:DUF1254 domain-containing protein n=1 Tax=Raoultella planticola TaxID=575 RepID=UPI003DA8AEB7
MNMPAVAIYSLRRAAFENSGLKDNEIIACSKPATPHLEAITVNSTPPYITAFTDLQKGPVVLELPAAGADGSLYGQIVDAWQFTIADVCPVAPAGQENNWIPTSGKRPLPAMRFYGPTNELNHKTFKLADFERV